MEIVACSFVDPWVVNVDCLSTTITERRYQLEYELFHFVAKRLGITQVQTTTYDPQASSFMERFHLKALFSFTGVSQCIDALPFV